LISILDLEDSQRTLQTNQQTRVITVPPGGGSYHWFMFMILPRTRSWRETWTSWAMDSRRSPSCHTSSPPLRYSWTYTV